MNGFGWEGKNEEWRKEEPETEEEKESSVIMLPSEADKNVCLIK